jgi:hypothetical protein
MSNPKQSFGQVATETYDEREKRLQEAIDRIEQRLSANDQPRPELKPKGVMRAQGDRLGREAAERQRTNIEQELQQIRKERDQAKTIDSNGKGKSL